MTDQFKPIGDKVDKVAPAAAVDGADGEDERVVEQIESLCMNCEENVSRTPQTE
jgi:zinc finger protein